MSYFVALLISHAAVFGGGWYCHYRFGSSLKAKAQALETRIEKALGK